MVADIGTRRCTTLETVKQGSTWTNGYEWMKKDEATFPTLTSEEISLNAQETQEMKKELKNCDDTTTTTYTADVHKKKVPDEVLERYKFSNYLIDPNLRRFDTTVRIVAFIFRFINKLKKARQVSYQQSTLSKIKVILTDKELKTAENYFYEKATAEVKKFNNTSRYKHNSTDVNGILRYTGRILPTDSVTILGRATQSMKDLTSKSFCVPMVDKHSPIAYSIVNQVHWYHPTAAHSGVETVWRYVLQQVYIIEGRSLVKMVRSSCERCRYLNKKSIDVAMGPVSPHNLTIAPAFYITQVDLAGPFHAYSQHHKRTTVKVWILVFCCCATTTTNLKLMDDYSTTSFLNGFMRFSCEVGYPKTLLPDEGGQLIKGCESMKLDFWTFNSNYIVISM